MAKIRNGEIETIREALARRTVRLADGTAVPCLGQGTWRIGDVPSRAEEEIRTLRLGVELGMSVIDTAEMYGEGRAESLVGEAVRGMRDRVFLVSKVYPHNAGRDRITRSCEASLRRLRTDRLDLYLLHWRGNVPLEETAEEMEKLVKAGKILRWGVSNLDASDMEELFRTPAGTRCAANQVLYHLGSRGIEFDLLPWQRKRGVPTMAYCPLAQAGTLRTELLRHQGVRAVAERHGATPFQLLLAWCVRHGDVLAIPKASTEAHVLDNARAILPELTAEDIADLDRAFPGPTRKMSLDVV